MSVKAETHTMETNRNHDTNYVFGPPESSGEESDAPSQTSAVISPKAPKAGLKKTADFPAKRPASTAASSRPKRQKLKDEPSLDTIMIPEDPISNELFGFTSSGSQKRRTKTYGRKFQIPAPIEEDSKPRETKHGLKVPDALESPKKSVRKSKFMELEDVPKLNTARGERRTTQEFVLPGSPEDARTSKRQKADFRVPDALDFSSSGGTESRSIPDLFESPERKSHKRSGSTSSLSSIDDMIILAHEDDYKAELEPDPSPKLCPVCEKPVRDSPTLFVPDNLHTLPFQQKQKFCTLHKIADAKEEWRERDYPKIYWEAIESFRIPEKLTSLGGVISRQTPSFYLDQLDAKINAARRDRKKIRNYLNEGITDIVKPGYYGPKGARIMVNAITASLTETLNKARQSDPALREAGVGGYVSAVLVPELTLQLVMGDMGLKTVEEGRKVLDESTAIGELLNPDDDHVE